MAWVAAAFSLASIAAFQAAGESAAAAATPAVTLTVVSPSVEVCPVTKPDPEPVGTGSDYLATNYDFDGSDQGISVDDPLNGVTWFFAGDAKAADSKAWWGKFGSNAGGANVIGYLSGADYGNPAGLCADFKLITVPGMTSSTGGAVFSPDVVVAPPNDVIGNFIFNPTPNSGNAATPVLAPNSGIPGINEAATGAFLQPAAGAMPEAIYLFYAGSPGVQVTGGTLGFPVTSVSYLTAWPNPTPAGSTPNVSPTTYQIVARVDYSLENTNTTFCPANFPATTCPPAPPPGWQATAPTPPLGGHFVWVWPVPAPDGFVYLFGTGKYRASYLYLARIPSSQVASIGHCIAPPCYLGQSTGFQIWTTAGPNGSSTVPGWSSGPPSAAEIAGAAPLTFPDDTTPDLSQVSVRRFGDVANGLWLMLQAPVGNPSFDHRVIARWSTSPAGPWSSALVVFDDGPNGGTQNQALYCCQGPWNGKLDPSGLKVWSCLTPGAGVGAQQIMECNDASPSQTSGSAGSPRYGFYSPFMLPYDTNLTTTSDTVAHTRTDTFTLNYLLSIFEPYDSVLMKATLRVVSPLTVARKRGAKH